MTRPLLEVTRLTKHFPASAALARRAAVRAVDGISLAVHRGETLGVVGESGSGKSTLGRCMLRLVDPTSGSIRFDGVDITRLSQRRLVPHRREMQMVFQNPYDSLNARRRISSIIGDVLRAHGERDRRKIAREVGALLQSVGLPEEMAWRYPSALSGGQRQRVSIARALALRPKLVVADEPVSALDVSIRAQILDLIAGLSDRLGVSYLFISHDLSVVRAITDRVLIMQAGKIVETGDTETVFADPQHPYTQALIAATPDLDKALAQRAGGVP